MVNEVGCWQTEAMTAAPTFLLQRIEGGWLLDRVFFDVALDWQSSRSSWTWILVLFDKFGNDFKDVVAVEVVIGIYFKARTPFN